MNPALDSHPYEAPLGSLSSDVTHQVLPNGLTVLVKEVYPASVVSLALWARVGSLEEPNARAGIAHFVEHMLFKGTPKRPVGRIAQEVHELGGYLNGFTSYDCTCYWIVLPSRHFKLALDIQADALLHPLFEPEEVGKEGPVILEELKMYEDRPSSFAFEKLMGLAYRTHRYGRPIIGFEEGLKTLNRDHLVEFYDTYYPPNNLAVSVVGNISTPDVLEAIQDAMGSLRAGVVPSNPSPVEPPQREFRQASYTGDIKGGHLQMGFHIPGIFEDDAIACDVLASILGEGRSSRLTQTLRERRGLVSEIGAGTFLEKDPGLLCISAVLEPARFDAVRGAVAEEVARVQQEGITPQELQKAKNVVESNYVFSQEMVEEQARALGQSEMMGDYRLADLYAERVSRVTREQVQHAARRYLVEENCSVVTYEPRPA